MDRRTFLAISLCFLIFLVWQKIFIEPRMPVNGTALVTAEPKKAEPAPLLQAASTTAVPIQENRHKGEVKKLELHNGTLIFNEGNSVVSNWVLKNYHAGLSSNSNINETTLMDLQTMTIGASKGGDLGEGRLAFDSPEFAYLEKVEGRLSSGPGGSVRWDYEDVNVKINREMIPVEGQTYFQARYQAEIKPGYTGTQPHYAFISLVHQTPEKDPENPDRQLVYWTNKEISRVVLEKDVKLQEIPTAVKWVGFTSRYFLMALISDEKEEALLPRGLVQPLESRQGRMSLVYPIKDRHFSAPLRVYFGPKEIEMLRGVEPTLDHTVDLGWFTIFAYPLLRIMQWFYSIFHNYGVSIILLTLLVRIVTYPLTYKSMKSMKEMAKLQPQLQKIKEKYKDDKEALNREMLTMMKSHGYNPMAGCLPILIQMPIFFALYRVLYSSIELYQAPFVFWIHDLSAKDPYYVTPIILTITMFVQQKLTPNTAADPAQAKMMQFMPVMFGVFMLALPSGLTLYMFVNALGGIFQQTVLNKKFSSPHAQATAIRVR